MRRMLNFCLIYSICFMQANNPNISPRVECIWSASPCNCALNWIKVEVGFWRSIIPQANEPRSSLTDKLEP